MRNECNMTRNLRPGRFMKKVDILDLKSKRMPDKEIKALTFKLRLLKDDQNGYI